MQFTKLRLTGFKSFVDSTELDIGAGVTGIVGPNGCGKSNLVEALKWAMGETSAKQMRGSEMDDVIFSGTSDRPARNIAEVVLELDNAERNAPAAFNDADVLEISRRIEREKGSSYKVNARDVRAKDVQLLFADAATGSRSTALVSQGHIGAIVSAKPQDRRKILEEAAGITGLHSRRHEAELRLRGAETNLERLDDVLVTLEAQMASLRKQVRQATRYKNLSGLIRRAEATWFLIRWRELEAELARAETQLAEAEKTVAEMAGAAGRASTERTELATRLPELRSREAEAAAALQRLVLAREALDEEERRLGQARESLETRLGQLDEDMKREREHAADAETALKRLSEERSRLTAGSEDEDGALEEARQALETARAAYDDASAKLTQATEAMAHDEARRGDLARRQSELETRIERLGESRRQVAEELAELRAATEEQEAVVQAAAESQEAAAALETARAAARAAENERTEAQMRLSAAQDQAQQAHAALNRLEAEDEALTRLLGTGDPDLWPPVIDAVTVEPGYEAALGAALGDDLTAATDEAAPVHWRRLAPRADAPPVPAGARPMSDHVQGPDALMRRLGQIGVVADAETAWRLLPELRQGQRLVTRDGGLWRWDGYTASVDTPAPAAVRLEQRNRLAEIREQLEDKRAAARAADSRVSEARSAAESASQRQSETRARAAEAETRLSDAQEQHVAARQAAAAGASRLAAAEEAEVRIAGELEEAEAALAETRAAAETMPDPEQARQAAAVLRRAADQARTDLVVRQAAFDTAEGRAEERKRRLGEIADEVASWTNRRDSAERQIAALTERRNEAATELESLANRPDEISTQRAALMDQHGEAERLRRAAADELASVEAQLAEADKRLREAEAAASQARENRVRAEAAVDQNKQSAAALTERIRDRLDCVPGQLEEVAELKEGAELPELEAAEKRVERLHRERDNMGPVNLRAEAEAQELEEQIATMTTERDDLIKAIEKLRRGISELNREGRRRLLESYEEVDKHFQELFTKLFAGGRAHLTLVDSDDPLEAGIEIMASPPGKRLQVLSLLSGGEQALTALSLLFAVFLTNPAPICVLDEVDAPLDDANVDRFCTLVEEIAQARSTRFLIITHHRMTMARMDRLYGVTMGEQGVSQLVSVDLGQAMAMRATA